MDGYWWRTKIMSYSSDYRRCMDVNVESMNWLVLYCTTSSCSNMSRVSVMHVTWNSGLFTLLDLVLWRRYSPEKLAHVYYCIRPIIAAYSILSFWVEFICTASLNYSCGEAVRRVRSTFYSRCDTQLKRGKNWDFPSSNSTCSQLLFLKFRTTHMYSQY